MTTRPDPAPESREAGLRYPDLLLRGRPGVVQVFLGIGIVGVVFILAQAVITLPFYVAYKAAGLTTQHATDKLAGEGVTTPSYLAYVNLNLALAIPIVLGVGWFIHRVAPGFVVSVAGRMRWRWLATCLGLAFVTLVITVVVSALVPGAVGGQRHAFTSTTLGFILVIALLTPLQAAGEEFAFRGYLSLTIGRLFTAFPRASTYVVVIVSSTLFAFAHGAAQGLPIFVDRFSFGVVASLLVILTGGLEAGIAMHVLNNFVAFGQALAFSTMTKALHATGGHWIDLVSTLTQSLVYLALVLWAARRAGVQTRTGPRTLERPAARV